MEKRDERILDAATQVFLRYGVKRASMGDIAAEAGVARQTLYNCYANKDDILRGSIRAFGDAAMAAIENDLAGRSALGDQIDLVFREMVVKPFAFMHASPNAQDLIDGYNDAGRTEMEAVYRGFEDLLARVLTPYADAIEARGTTVAHLSETLRRAGAAIKHQARDDDHVQSLLTGLRVMAVAAAGAPDKDRPV